MKKTVYLLISLAVFANIVFAAELKGGVSFDVKSARNYVQEGQLNNIKISENYQFEPDKAEKIIHSYNPQGEVIGITVQYRGEPDKAYIYDKNHRLIYFDKYDKPVNVYPHRGYRYNLDGKLVLTSLTVSKNELFRFDPAGNLIAHSIDGIIYDENGKVIGKAK